MITIQQCKKIYGKNCTDEEISAMRDNLYHFAKILVGRFAIKTKRNPATVLQQSRRLKKL